MRYKNISRLQRNLFAIYGYFGLEKYPLWPNKWQFITNLSAFMAGSKKTIILTVLYQSYQNYMCTYIRSFDIAS